MFTTIEKKNEYINYCKDVIKDYGGFSRGKEKYIWRENIQNKESKKGLPDQGAFFGCINEGEDTSGPYSDLSVVIFPSNEENDIDDRWIIALVVGSLGFKNDYHLISIPGTRRIFMNCLGKDSFIKNDFIDIESRDGFSSFCGSDNHSIPETLKNAVKDYQNLILACTLFDPNDGLGSKEIIKKYIAIYAILREWPNKQQKKEAESIIQGLRNTVDEKKEIEELLHNRRYIVLQGAPGTGKTRMAKELTAGKKYIFFTQFHAETTYSDFIYGIIPDVTAESLRYVIKKGVFVQAIEKARENTNEEVYLIIDEINRANLSNVLGQAFYLFEPTMSDSNIEVEVCPELSLIKLPDNLYIIATMNTADRSLAVVDFALRRRFAWFTMSPHTIICDAGMKFCKKEFNEISYLFEKYATDEELNLQPGQAYFIVSEKDTGSEIKNRMKYEIMPLIKEYFNNGIMTRAKDDFVNYFKNEIDVEMYR